MAFSFNYPNDPGLIQLQAKFQALKRSSYTVVAKRIAHETVANYPMRAVILSKEAYRHLYDSSEGSRGVKSTIVRDKKHITKRSSITRHIVLVF